MRSRQGEQHVHQREQGPRTSSRQCSVARFVNFFGPLRIARAFASILAENGGGAIVNVLSILGRVLTPRLGSYAASKAAAFSATQSMRAKLAARGVLVVGVMPAFVDTAMAERAPDPKLSPDDVARSIVDAITRDLEEVYPGVAADAARDLQRDPKEVERRFASLLG